MLSTILNLLTLVGLLFGAGYVGGWVAEYNGKRARHDVSNIGFFSGASGGGFVVLLAVAAWWSGWLHIKSIW
jgi:hypothetical protein